MSEEETVEQVDETIEKEGATKQYSQEYFEELRAAAKEYLPKPVWDHIHRKARDKAGGRVSGKARSAASAAASSPNASSAEAVTQPPEVEAQLEQARAGSIAQKSEGLNPNAYPEVEAEVEKQPADDGEPKLHPDCQKVADNCMKMKKSEEDDVEKVAHGKQDAPIADTGGWDAGAAEKRLLAWAGGPDKDNVNWSKFGKGFLYHDPANADNIGGYKFPIADIVDGQFKVNRAALAAAAGRINQSSGIPASELDSMKATLRSYYKDIGEDAPDTLTKEEEIMEPTEPIKPHIGSRPLAVDKQPLITFVAASPGVIESLRKEALVGPAGRIFNEQYLKPLGLTREDIAITYIIPRLLKDEAGRVREPTEHEIASESFWKDEQTERTARRERSDAPSITVALGHTVKGVLGSEVNVTLPHPNALGTARTDEELIRKREQLKKMVDATLNYAKFGRFNSR